MQTCIRWAASPSAELHLFLKDLGVTPEQMGVEALQVRDLLLHILRNIFRHEMAAENAAMALGVEARPAEGGTKYEEREAQLRRAHPLFALARRTGRGR
jgi:hypothetical protein